MKNNGETTENNRDSGLLSNPLSFLRNGGYFAWYDIGIYDRGGRGYYWSLRSTSTTLSNYLDFYSSSLNSLLYYDRGSGFAVR